MFAFIKRFFGHPSAPEIYSYHPARVFTNGAQQVTFDFDKALPLYSPIGPATATGFLRSLQPPQTYHHKAVPIAGLGGLQAGQLASQPLVNADFTPIE